jgi:hypothetical protein
MKTLLSLAAASAAALSMSFAAGAAMAASGGHSGNFPLTVSHSQFLNGSYCLTVTDDGSGGWAHSGEATIPQYTYGTFQVIQGEFMADIVVPAQGQNEVLVFNGAGHNGSFGNGAAVLLSGGEPLDSGTMKVGTKGGC